jgi:hypothetical protein
MAIMPVIEVYRGVGIHDFQDRHRIETIVKPEIDATFAISNPEQLMRYAGDIRNSPESRLFAGDKYIALAESRVAAHDHRLRNRERLAAMLAGTESLDWASPWGYGSLLDVPRPPGQTGHAPRPPEHAAALEAAQAAADAAERGGEGSEERQGVAARAASGRLG